MTLEMQEMLEEEMASAEEANDKERIQRVMVRATLALVDCQRKTSERVKKLEAKWDEKENKAKGAAMLWDVLKVLASAGGGAIILKVLGAG